MLGHDHQRTSEQVGVFRHQAFTSPVSTGLPKSSSEIQEDLFRGVLRGVKAGQEAPLIPAVEGVGDMKIMENSFADLEYEGKKSKMRRELFLERMQMLIPWDRLLEQIRPYCSKAGKGRASFLSAGVHAASALRPTLLQSQ